jgi:UDP-glucose 4-epimerase
MKRVKTKNITVVGANSNTAKFIKKRLQTQSTGNTWRFISHSDVATSEDLLRQSDVVLNLSVHPEIMRAGTLNDETNLDVRLARINEGSKVHYIMASTRKVYGNHPVKPEITEESPIAPECGYGQAKVEIERQLANIIPPSRLSIVRFTNVAGFNDFTQAGLVGTVFNRLAHGQPVKMTLDPDCARDFLPQHKFSEIMVAFTENPAAGTFNLGSGVGLPLRNIMDTWAGVFGATVAYEPQQREAGFWLNSGRIHDATAVIPFSPEGALRSLRQEACAARQAAGARAYTA